MIKEIQLLRAISLILVLLFHLEITNFSKGYIGVDIFFVISGFIFSKILTNSFQNKFSFTKYFRRRAQRLFPGLIFTLILVTMFSWVYLTPIDLRYYGQSLFSSLIFLSNFYYFIINNDYFAPNSYPLVHLWSLSLEIQFYILFPIIFFLCLKIFKLKKNISLVIFIIIIFSFTLNVFYSDNIKLIFYNLPFRIWEFFFGYLIYDLINSKSYKNYLNKKLISVFIIFFLYLIFGSSNFVKSQIYAIFLFYFIFVFFHKNNKKYNFILNNSIINFIADKSYSIFLVHYPIIYFMKYFQGYDPVLTINQIIIIVALIFIISLLINFFEVKFYKYNIYSKSREKKLYSIFSLLIILLCFGYYFHFTNGTKLRSIFYKNLDKNYFMNSKKSDSTKKIGSDYCNLICFKSDRYSETLLLYGDSHAGDIEYSLSNFTENNKINLYISYDLKQDENRKYQMKQLSEILNENKIDYVLILNHVRIEYEDYFKEIEKMITNFPNIKFYYFLPRVQFNDSPIKYKMLRKKNILIDMVNIDKINKKLSILKNKNLFVINQNDLILRSINNCNELDCFDGHNEFGEPLYRDPDHLTIIGSDILIKNFFKYHFKKK